MTTRPTALVTGASAGIGAAFATLLAERGHDLVLVARRRDRLEALATQLADRHEMVAHVEVCDLSTPDAPRQLAAELAAKSIDVDVLVNNAGYGLSQLFLDADWQAHRDFIEVLLTSTVHLTHAFTPAMVERGHGRIVNIASLAGFAPEPAGSLYSPCKKFMVSFTRSLALELEGTGVTATAVCPGFTYSEFHDVMDVREDMNRLPKWMWQEARPVVEEGWRATEAGRMVVVTGFVNKLFRIACAITPFWLAQKLAPKVLRERMED